MKHGQFIVISFAALLAGCAVGPDYARPELELRDQHAAALDSDIVPGNVDVAWWRTFEDQTLHRLIDDALAGNQQITVARANLERARARLSEVARLRFPIGDLSGSASREKFSAANFGGQGSLPSQSLYSATLSVGWELDFFGRVRRNVAAAAADADSARARLGDAQVLIAAEVGLAYATLRGAQTRLAVARRNADNQRDTLDLTQTLLDGGRGTRLDVARARSQFESTLASIPPLETVIRAEIYRLGVLLGRSPDALVGELASAVELPVIPERMTVALPSELIARRPDVQEAEFALIAATERIGVATAELYPRFDLFASLGRTSLSLGGLDNSSAETYRYGVSAVWPIFDLSRVRARIAVADADALAALATFEERFLQAQAEVETALVRFMNERRRQGHLQTSADETGRAVTLARQRFESGVDNFLQVLDAERRLLEIEDQLAISSTDVVRSLINLYKAMGGGWIERAQVVSADEAESPTPDSAVRSM